MEPRRADDAGGGAFLGAPFWHLALVADWDCAAEGHGLCKPAAAPAHGGHLLVAINVSGEPEEKISARVDGDHVRRAAVGALFPARLDAEE